MGNIVLLDDLTINKIAAGEVIERPASVVKEMVENSIDAGAKNIVVEIKNGGISYIRVSDDGKGIEQDDMEIAFERHATSKIRQADDLQTVKSMGFRGEALASIAAIANVEMVSKTANAEFGYRVVVEAGQVLEKEETGCATGTTITVKNLFFNTPVRYKFLKKDYTESGYIEDAITRLALVHPDIAFKLVNTGKVIIQTTGDGQTKNTIYSIFGKDIANGIIPLHYTYDDIIVDGVIGKPAIARNNRTHQMFFVNKRYVKDKTLSSAIEQAYKGMLTIGKHAFCILNLEMDPSQVDVNVHPAKLEVRFKEENKIFKSLYHAIKETLLKTDLVREPEKSTEIKNEESKSDNIILDQIDETKEINKVEVPKEEVKNQKEEIDIDKKFEEIARNYQTEKSQPKFSNFFKRRQKETDSNEKMSVVEQLYYQKNNITPLEKTEPVQQTQVPKIEYKFELYNEPEIKNEAKDRVDTIIENNAKEKTIEKKENEPNIGESETLESLQNENIESIDKIDFKPYPVEENKSIDFEQMYQKTFGKEVVKEDEETYKQGQMETVENQMKPVQGENISVFDTKEIAEKQPKYKFIGIAFSTYIILEIENDIYILDQHAAHERIMYEKVKKNFYSDEAKDSQMMLLPDIITLTHKEMDITRENISMFEKAGFILEEFGDNTIKLVGVPNICMELDTKELFMDILDAIDTVAITAKQEKEDKFIATIACKAAVKANMALSIPEVDALMQDLLKLPNPFTCPHGRPTAIKMSKIDIEKKFSRR